MDLAATDILRHRELGVPRYCEFRRLLHLTAPRTFDELTDDRATPAGRCARLYGPDDIERLDLMVGLFAERLPRGLRLQRHRVPHLHPDGVPAAEQRPVLHHRLHPGRLHPGRAGVDRGQLHGARSCCGTTRSCGRRCAARPTRSAAGSAPADAQEARPGASRPGRCVRTVQSNVSAPVGSTCSHRVHRLAQLARAPSTSARRARFEFPSGRCSGRLCHGL